jgi:hypothetical protein
MDTQTKKSVDVIQKALLSTGFKEHGMLAETNEEIFVGLAVGMLAGFTVDTVLATKSFMNSRSDFSSYVHDDYVHYADEFLEYETNEGLLAACKLKCDELNERAGLNQKVPTPTIFGVHACNSLVVEGYLSMLYVTGTLGTASTLETARAGYVIAKLVALWLAPGDNSDLLSAQKWKNWLKLKLRALEAGLVADGVKYKWVTCTLKKNTEDIHDAHFFPGRGPPTHQDVRMLNADLLERFFDVVKKGEGAGGYSLNDMVQQFMRASKRAGVRSGQLLKAVIAIENAAEMVFDESQLHVSLDLVLKGINPTKANMEAEKKEVKLILDLVGNPNAQKAGEVLMMGGMDTLVLADNLPGAVRIPLKMLDVKKGLKVFAMRHNGVLAKTVFQVVGKDIRGANEYPKETLRASLLSEGVKAAQRWTKPILVDAVKEWYQTKGADDGTGSMIQAYSTQPWVSLWSQQDGAPIEDTVAVRKRKATPGKVKREDTAVKKRKATPGNVKRGASGKVKRGDSNSDGIVIFLQVHTHTHTFR